MCLIQVHLRCILGVQVVCLFMSIFIQPFLVLKFYVMVCRILSFNKLLRVLEERVKLRAVSKIAFIWNKVVYELNGITVVQGHRG